MLLTTGMERMAKIFERMSLSGRTAVVTGAGGHIGRVICHALAEQKARVLLVDQPGTDLAALQTALERTWNVQAKTLFCDLENPEQRAKLLATLAAEPQINVLVNNAAFVSARGVTGWVSKFEEQTTEIWRRALEVNLTAVFDLTKGLSAVMRGSAGANIINVGSIYGMGAPDYSVYEGTSMGNAAGYAASKGGLLQLTRWLATTLAPDIRVNAVSPGGIERGQPESFVKRYKARTPLGRMGTEDDMAGAVAYLASDLAAYVTGHNLVVDGGWSVW